MPGRHPTDVGESCYWVPWDSASFAFSMAKLGIHIFVYARGRPGTELHGQAWGRCCLSTPTAKPPAHPWVCPWQNQCGRQGALSKPLTSSVT